MGVGIHIKYHAVTSNGNSGYMGQLQERRRTAITVETENRKKKEIHREKERNQKMKRLGKINPNKKK